MNPLIIFGGAAGLVIAPVMAMCFVGGGTTSAQAATCGASGAASTLGWLDAGQTANATVIVEVGGQLGVPSFGQVIAVATALAESGLRNLNYGDADSLGLFQQRPSQGWGSPAQILDPTYAVTAFYDHLLAVPGWYLMPLTQAAQAVQRSGFPDAYAKWQTEATRLVQQITGRNPAAGPSAPAIPASASPLPGSPAGSAPPAVCGVTTLPPGSAGAVLGFAAAQVGKTYVLGATGPNAWDCSALAQAAYATAGVGLPRTADEQYDYARAHGQVFAGPPAAAGLRPGDLLFSPGDDPVPAADGKPIGHVAIYAGGGVVIEAKGARWGVISTTYTTGDFAQVTFVARLVAPPPAAPSVAASAAGSMSGQSNPSQKGRP